MSKPRNPHHPRTPSSGPRQHDSRVMPLVIATAFIGISVACGVPDPSDAGSTPATIEIARGDEQTAQPGQPVPVPPAVLIRNSSGTPLENVPVSFFITSGDGTIDGAEASTGADGIARLESWTLGPQETENTLVAAAGTLTPVLFRAWALHDYQHGRLVNADFSEETGEWGSGEGPTGWTLLMTEPGAMAAVKPRVDATEGNAFQFRELAANFGANRIDQCVQLEAGEHLAFLARVQTSLPSPELRIRLNAEMYATSEDCEADTTEDRIHDRVRVDFEVSDSEGVFAGQWHSFSTGLRVEGDEAVYARLSFRARNRTTDGAATDANLLVDLLDLVPIQPPPPPTAPPSFQVVEVDGQKFLEISTVTEDAVIHYTLDGTYPYPFGERATAYQKPFPLPQDAIVRAVATAPGHQVSEVATTLRSLAFEPRREFPQIHIHSLGMPINSKKIRVPAEIVVRNDDASSYSTAELYRGRVGIRGRGNSSWQAPKKPYNLKFWDDEGRSVDFPLLGMPAESDWLLIANHSDKSLLRNRIAYELSRSLGRYSPRNRHVEVFLNGTYEGLYLLVERPKRGADRVPVQAPSEADVTGGYMLEIMPPGRLDDDETGFSTNSGVFLAFNHPKEPSPNQLAYVRAWFQDFEAALEDETSELSKVLDIDSVIDWLLVNEFARNNDAAFVASIKMFQQPGSKLQFGPVWDFDIGWGNINYSDNHDPRGWGIITSRWFGQMMQRDSFRERFVARWREVRELLGSVPALVTAEAETIRPAADRNFERWDIIGKYVWPNPDPIPDSWDGEIETLKRWIETRLQWTDANLESLERNPPQ